MTLIYYDRKYIRNIEEGVELHYDPSKMIA